MSEPDPIIACIAKALSEHEPPLIWPGAPGDERIAFYEALAERVNLALAREGYTEFHPFPPGATAGQRSEIMSALMEGRLPPGPLEAKVSATACNRCGMRVWIEAPPAADMAHLVDLATAGWAFLDGIDLCPDCAP